MGYLNKSMADIQAILPDPQGRIIAVTMGTKIRMMVLMQNGDLEAWVISP